MSYKRCCFHVYRSGAISGTESKYDKRVLYHSYHLGNYKRFRSCVPETKYIFLMSQSLIHKWHLKIIEIQQPKDKVKIKEQAIYKGRTDN